MDLLGALDLTSTQGPVVPANLELPQVSLQRAPVHPGCTAGSAGVQKTREPLSPSQNLSCVPSSLESAVVSNPSQMGKPLTLILMKGGTSPGVWKDLTLKITHTHTHPPSYPQAWMSLVEQFQQHRGSLRCCLSARTSSPAFHPWVGPSIPFPIGCRWPLYSWEL